MTLKECLNMWIAQYNEFKEQFDKAVKVNPNFKFVVDLMSKKYEKYNYDELNELADFSLSKKGYEVCVTICKNNDGTARLSIVLNCWFSSDDNDMVDCTINDLSDTKFLEKMKSKFGDKFDTDIYTISVSNMEDDDFSFEDRHTVIDYEDENEALDAARELAEELAMSYNQCICISVYAGEKRKPSGDIVGDDTVDIFTISTKSRGETVRARKRAGYCKLTVDEYADENISRKMGSASKVIVLFIVKLDNDGNISYSADRYESVEKARERADELLREWLEDNEFTCDETEAEKNFMVLCTKEECGNLITVTRNDDIDEFDALIKEF